MGLSRVREKYGKTNPEILNLSDAELAESLYQTHYKGKMSKQELFTKLGLQSPESDNKTGVSGIANDVMQSARSAPDALLNMVTGLAKSAKGAGKYALTTNPVSTLANIGAGGVEGGAALLSSPQMMMRYIAEKFPNLAKDNGTMASHYLKNAKQPTDYENLMRFEQQHGLTPQSEDERGVRDIGNLIFGGKGLTKIPSRTGRVAALSAQQAGAGGDPLHAAMLGMIGEYLNSRMQKKVQNDANAPAAPAATFAPPSATAGASFNQPIMPGMNVTLGGFGVIPEAVKAIPDVMAQIPEVAGDVAQATKKAGANVAAGGAELFGKALSGMKVKGADTAGEMLGDYIRFKSISPEEYAVKKVLGDIKAKHLPKIQESMDAARRLNIEYWTPAEATGSTRESAKQGGIGRTDEGLDRLQERAEARLPSESRAVNDFLNEIYDPDKLATLKNEKYRSAMQSELPFEFIGRHRNRPTVVKAIQEIKNNPALRQLIEEEVGAPFDSINPNTFQYWDIVKQAMDELEESSKTKQGKATTSSRVYADTRKEIVKQMDKINPDYKPARRIAERGFVRRNLESYFDSRKKNILTMAKYLEKDSNKDYLLKKLNDLPIALQKMKDFETLGKTIIPVSKTTRASKALSETSMSDARNPLEAKKRALQQKYGEAHDVAAVDLMTHPQWFEILKEKLGKKGK